MRLLRFISRYIATYIASLTNLSNCRYNFGATATTIELTVAGDTAADVRPKMLKSVSFHNFKSLERYQLGLRLVNLLVGPNNSGKSTILDGLRALEAAMRFARNRVPMGGAESAIGYGAYYDIPEHVFPISMNNISTNYSDSDVRISAETSNENRLSIIFSRDRVPKFVVESRSKRVVNLRSFQECFPFEIVSVPTLGPFEEEEQLIGDESYLRRYSGSRRASRMFRNIWHRRREKFEEFRALVEKTWPGVSIKLPELQMTAPAKLNMFSIEGRIDREIYWAGFGFQVWLQFLTHVLAVTKSTVLIVDEPEVYLHPDLQRQLFNLVQSRSGQCVLATHSVEIINEADPDDVVLVNKRNRSASRVKDIDGLQAAYELIGSRANIHLDRLSRGRRILFFEGDDFTIYRRFAKQLGLDELYSGSNLTVIPLGGFSQWRRVETAAWTFKKILSTNVQLAAVFDSDFRPADEIQEFLSELAGIASPIRVLGRKEIENYVLVPEAIAKAVYEKIDGRNKGVDLSEIQKSISTELDRICEEYRDQVLAQRATSKSSWMGRQPNARRPDMSTLILSVGEDLKANWSSQRYRLSVCPGKAVLSDLSRCIQEKYKCGISIGLVLRHLRKGDVDADFLETLELLNTFSGR